MDRFRDLCIPKIIAAKATSAALVGSGTRVVVPTMIPRLSYDITFPSMTSVVDPGETGCKCTQPNAVRFPLLIPNSGT